jgi:hypothetical protein
MSNVFFSKKLPIGILGSGILGFYRGTQHYGYNCRKDMEKYDEYLKEYNGRLEEYNKNVEENSTKENINILLRNLLYIAKNPIICIHILFYLVYLELPCI